MRFEVKTVYDYLIVCPNTKIATKAFDEARESIARRGITARIFPDDRTAIVGDRPDRVRVRYVSCHQYNNRDGQGFRGRVVFYDDIQSKGE